MAGEKERLREAFARRYPGAAAPRVFRAPGRVNLIGEHTDYNLGFVLPVALELACFTATAPNADGLLRVYAANLGEERAWPVDWIGSLKPAGDWGDYVAGVAQQLMRSGHRVEPANLLIDSTVPVGAGLSSSAALEVSVAQALLRGGRIDPMELARLCRRAENEFVGLPCGIMDQAISIFGEENAAMLLDCRSLEHQSVRLPGGVAFIAVNSMVKHELGGSAYRDRVAECRQAVEQIRKRHPAVESLRDATPDHLELLEGAVLRRARHVVREHQRVTQFIAASKAGETGRMGQLLVASHESLRDDYEVSCVELDTLVELAMSTPGVLGARMTGGGFGGCTINMMASEAVPEFQQRMRQGYGARFGIEPQIYPCRPSAGAGECATL